MINLRSQIVLLVIYDKGSTSSSSVRLTVTGAVPVESKQHKKEEENVV